MKIYFTPNGVGLGHIRRTEAIAESLGKKGCSYIFSTYLDGLDYAKERGIPVIATTPLQYRTTPSGAVDYKATVALSGLSLGVRRFLIQLLKEVRYIKRFKPDLIFSDSRASPLIAGKMLGIPSILLLNQFKVEIIRKPKQLEMTIWDHLFFIIANVFWMFMRTILTWIWGLSELILIPDYSNPLTISIANLAIPRRYMEKVKYIGPILEIESDRLPSKKDIRKRFNFNISRPLIYCAVSGPKFERRILSNKLEKTFSTFTGNCQIVLTKGEHELREISRHGNLLTISWVDEKTQYELLKSCDAVVCRAGHGMITKAVAYGKPMVLVPIPDHTEQLSNAQRAVKMGFAQILDQETFDTVDIQNALKKLGNDEVTSKLEYAEKDVSQLNALKVTGMVIIDLLKHTC